LLFRLQALYDQLSSEKGEYVCVFIDGQAHQETSRSEFYSEILDKVCAALNQRDGRILPAESPQENIGLAYLRRAINSLIGRGIKLVLLIDEFDVLCENHNFDLAFFNGLRSLATLGVVYVTASKRTLFQLNREKEVLGSPFFNYFDPLYLGLFSEESALRLIREPSAERGVRFDEQMAAEILHLAGRHPFFLQRVCSIAFEMCCVKGEPLSQRDIEQVRAKSGRALQDQMASYWEDLGPEEQQILLRVAAGQAVEQDSEVALENLAQQCFLVRSNGGYQLFSTLFKDYVLAQPRPEFLGPLKWLDRFQNLEELGEGMMSVVYKAYQPVLNRYVVIKELRLQPDILDDYPERFRREALLIARLDHPNILPVYDFYLEVDRAYIVMKYASGGSLADRLRAEGPFDPTKAVNIITVIGRALGYAHKQGVIHRDIKPANIFLGEDDWPLLGDFGLALMLGEMVTDEAGMTGSFDCISPEQTIDARRLDHRSDIYSLGVVLYQLLVGEVPYAEMANAGDRLMKRLTQGVPPPRSKNPQISLEMERIILKATASDPDDRYQAAMDMVEDLEASISGAGALAGTVVALLAVMGLTVRSREVTADCVRFMCVRAGTLAGPLVVVCKEGAVERSDVDALIAEVTKQGLGGGMIVTHTRVSPVARERAAATDGVARVFTLDEFYRELADFEPYLRALIDGYENDELSTYYVDLGCRSGDGSIYKPMDEYLDRWLDDPAHNHVSILGDYGTGKTSFCRQYAAELGRRWLSDPGRNRIPVLISLRDYGGAMNLEQIVADFLVNRCNIKATYEAFRRFNADGKLVLLFDGFDEMAQNTDSQAMVSSFGELARVVETRSKVILTCRTSCFHISEKAEVLSPDRSPEARTEPPDAALCTTIDLAGRPTFEIVHLLPIDRGDVRTVLQARFPAEWEWYYRQIEDTPNLAELAQRPVLLDMMARSFAKLKRQQVINAGRLYEAYTNLWLEREEKTSRLLVTRDDRRLLMQELALEMLQRGESSIHYSRLPERVRERFGLEKADEVDHLEYDIRTCLFLSRDSGGNYRFVHRSLQDFFVAQWFAQRVMGGSTPEIRISSEIRGFVRDLLEEVRVPGEAEQPEWVGLEGLPEPMSPLEALAMACVAGECVLYVGTGLGAQAGFPTWREFVCSLLDWAVRGEFIKGDVEDSLRAALQQDQHDVVVDGIVSALPAKGQQILHEYLREVFLDPSRQPPESYSILTEIGLSAILTTGFDQLLEQTHENIGDRVYTPEDAEPLLDAFAKREFFILKLYGALERPETVLLGQARYEDAIAANRPLSQFMESLFFSRTILFVGTSLEGIESFLGGFALGGYRPRQHYAVIPSTDSAWQAKADQLLRRYGVQVIPYTASGDDHSGLLKFLEELAHGVRARAESARAESSQGPARLKRVCLENIGPFDHLELDLHPRWNILLGDNGVGKSTILRAIAVAICGEDAQPYADRLIKTGKTSAQITLQTADRKYVTRILRTSRGAEVESMPVRPLEAEGWLALGFPPLRAMNWERPQGPRAEEGKRRPVPDDLLPLVQGDPDPRLNNLKQWVVNLDYQSKSEPTRSGGHRFEQVIQEFFGMVARLTEGMTFRFEGIDPATLEIKVKTDDGKVPIEAVSQGTASLIGWIGSLLQRMYEIYGYEVNPTEQYALVLIDEIDAHMHPLWQQSVVPTLAKLFPNAQFVATTHSPLVVGGMPTEQVFRLARDQDGSVVKVEIEPDMTMGRTDQVLTGSLFGLETTLDRITQEEIQEYQRLLGKRSRTEEEEEEFRHLQRVLEFRIPVPQETPPERRAQELLQALLLMQVGDMYPAVQQMVLKKAEQLFSELQARQAKEQ
jgi:tRNA A-37 threonylcarbamoyl transferase component Bud32